MKTNRVNRNAVSETVVQYKKLLETSVDCSLSCTNSSQDLTVFSFHIAS